MSNDIIDMRKKYKNSITNSLLDVLADEFDIKDENETTNNKNLYYKPKRNISTKEKLKRQKRKKNQKISRRLNRPR